MASFLQFGEDHPDYSVRVLNEREARGAAGIMFLFAMIAFMTAWFKGDFTPTKLTIVAFFIDFFIRVLINPRYSPTLIMARWMVNNQTAEYVGAPQKRFAWAIGLVLATFMMFLVVINDVRGPINMIMPGLPDTAFFRIGIWNLRRLQAVQLVQQRKGATLSRQCV